MNVELLKLVRVAEVNSQAAILSTNCAIPIEVATAIYISTLSFVSSVVSADNSGEDLRVYSLRKAFHAQWSLLDVAFQANGKVKQAVLDAIEMIFNSLPSDDEIEKAMLRDAPAANERPI